jgi:hypothetical protein
MTQPDPPLPRSLSSLCSGLLRLTWSDVASEKDALRSLSITEPSIMHAASMAAEDLALTSATREQQQQQQGAPLVSVPASASQPSPVWKSANFQMQPCTAPSSPPIPVLEDMA